MTLPTENGTSGARVSYSQQYSLYYTDESIQILQRGYI